MLDILLNAISLPLETYFSPRKLRFRTESLEASLPAGHTPLSVLLKNPPGGEKMRRWWLTLAVALLIVPAFVTLLAAFILKASNIPYTLLFATGMTWLLVVIFVLKIGVPVHLKYLPIAAGTAILLGCAIGILISVSSSATGTTDPNTVARFMDSPAGKLANAIILGSVMGMIIRIMVGGFAENMRGTMLAGIVVIVPFALLLATVSSPAVLEMNRLAALCMVMGFTGWFILPLQLVISLISWLLLRLNPGRASVLWRIAPVNHDDFLMVPLPGTVQLVATLYRADRMAYRRAVNRLKRHAFQTRLLAKIEAVVGD